MKKKDNLKELRDLSLEQLKAKVKELNEEGMKLRFRKSSGQLDQTHRFGEAKTQLAQAKTVLAEKLASAAG
ncbi:MAG: 50S ribosomal protein L29 [Bdellovibrionales bacterium]|nr:50S ribosomal protein L29 [Bdellovibrionales bacterium]